MKIVKSYTAKIDANASKVDSIISSLNSLKSLSEYVFNQEFDLLHEFNEAYKSCRNQFTDLNSKIIQNFLRLYRPVGKKTSPNSPINPIIILDYQCFNIQYNPKTKYTNYWLRFGRKNYPLRGKGSLSRIKDITCVKEVRIFRRKNDIYCKLTYVKEVSDKVFAFANNPIGIDINVKQLVRSDNKFHSTKRMVHRKLEHKKGRMKTRSLENYTKDFVHKLTTYIVSDLVLKEQEVLVLEDLKHLRQFSSKKNGTSKGKELNYRINGMPFGMFRSFLEYKCLEAGIKLVIISPQYTSKTCSRCGSLNTMRPNQSTFICGDCGTTLHADLNAARNISLRYTGSDGLPVNLALCPVN